MRPEVPGATVKIGQQLQVSIEGEGDKGDGIAKHEGFVIFVPGSKRGDTVNIRVTKVMTRFAFAEIVEAP